MNIASVLNIPKHFFVSFKRFPIVLIACFFISASLIYLNEFNNHLHPVRTAKVIHLITVLIMGLLLSLALYNLSESKIHSKIKKYLLQLIPIGFMLGYYIINPEQFSESVRYLRAFIISLSFLFLVYWLPFYRSNNYIGFWQYIRLFSLRFITALFFAYILYLGLILAVFALDMLFGVKIYSKLYYYIWVAAQFLFMPVFFLGHLSKDYTVYDKVREYPKFLKILILYILLPIVVLYMTILYAYGAKILFMWELPVGWVSNLVLSFSVVGLLSFLIGFPLKQIDNKYITWFFKLYFVFKLPLLALLFVAILTRVFEYGVTEHRYYVLLIAAWLTFIAVYYIINKNKNIKTIFLSFFLMAFFSTFGPWGAFSVSKKSQIIRFEKSAIVLGVLDEGKIVKVEKDIPFEDLRNMSSVVEYLVKQHGFDVFKLYLADEIYDTINGMNNRSVQSRELLKHMGLKYIDRWRYNEDAVYETVYFNFASEKERVLDVSNYSIMIGLNNTFYESDFKQPSYSYVVDNLKVDLACDFKTSKYNISISKFDSNQNILFAVDLQEMVNRISDNFSRNSSNRIPYTQMSQKLNNQGVEIEIQFDRLDGSYSQDNKTFKDISVNGQLFIKN